MAISYAKVSKLSRLTDRVIGIVRRDFRFVALIKKTLNFAIEFEKEYSGGLVASSIVNFVMYMTGSGFLIEMRSQPQYGYTRVSGIWTTYEGFQDLIESLNIEDARSKSLEIPFLDEFRCKRRPRRWYRFSSKRQEAW